MYISIIVIITDKFYKGNSYKNRRIILIILKVYTV